MSAVVSVGLTALGMIGHDHNQAPHAPDRLRAHSTSWIRHDDVFGKKKRPFKLLAILTFTLSAWSAHAQNSVIPYQGTLFSQGKPVSQGAPVQMAFALYTDKTGLNAGETSLSPAANRVWTSWVSEEGEDHTLAPGPHNDNTADDTISVTVRSGRFLIHLGEALASDVDNTQVEILDHTLDHESLYVVTWVAREGESGGYTAFRLPPQKLNTVPHAVTAKRAVNFEVMDTLSVNTLSPRDQERITVTGGLTVNGTLAGSSPFGLMYDNTSRSCQNGEFSFETLRPDASRFNAAKSRFIAPESGWYFFSFFISFWGGDGGDDTVYLRAYRNNDNQQTHIINPRATSGGTNTSNARENSQGFTGILFLNQNDEFYITLDNVDHVVYCAYRSRALAIHMISK